jgi:adenosine deaminase
MTEDHSPTSFPFYRELPKIELHRHLEGSLRVRTMMEVVRAHNLDVKDTGYLRPLVQVEQDDPYTFENFLAKFGTLRLFYKSPEIIQRITREAVEDAAADNVRYLELRFTPVALSRAEGFSIARVTDWVIESTREAESDFDIKVGLIASINRHEDLALAEEVTEVALDRVGTGVVGLDLAGNEADFPAAPFFPLLREARKGGLKLTIHAGEWSGADNVREAIEDLEVDRIGHGIRVLEDPRAVQLARESRVPFEVCITSNLHSGVVGKITEHPVRKMLLENLNVTINTDDPSISRITLGDEYRLVREELGLPVWTLRERVLAAGRAAFLPDRDRQKLVYDLAKEFSQKMLSES